MYVAINIVEPEHLCVTKALGQETFFDVCGEEDILTDVFFLFLSSLSSLGCKRKKGREFCRYIREKSKWRWRP